MPEAWSESALRNWIAEFVSQESQSDATERWVSHVLGRIAGKVMHPLDHRVGGEDQLAEPRGIVGEAVRARVQRQRTEHRDEVSFGHAPRS